MDKDKQKRIKEQIGDEAKAQEVEEITRQAQDIGLMPNDTALAKEVTRKMQNMAQKEDSTYQPMFRNAGSRQQYAPAEKFTALTLMDAFVNENEETGDLKPRYAWVSDMLGVPESTLRAWWEKRDIILSQCSAYVDNSVNIIKMHLNTIVMKEIQALQKVDFEAMVSGDEKDMKNFIALMNMTMNKMRLFSNLSTENVEHEHHGKVQMVIPD
tara:strand:- start:317 stop:952 length:636 start_codon:yes stop_codon:yes gene_type:complete